MKQETGQYSSRLLPFNRLFLLPLTQNYLSLHHTLQTEYGF